MVAYSFQKRFVPRILAGTKDQTIRADRKRHARAGELLQLYYGMRTRHCRLIGNPVCLSVQAVALRWSPTPVVAIDAGTVHRQVVEAPAELEHFARRDGFDGWEDLTAYWCAWNDEPMRDGMWLCATLIRWSPAYFTGIEAVAA